MCFSPQLFSRAKYSLQYVPRYAEQYFKLFNWKKNCKILDIGTGPGNLLFLVEPLFPKDYDEIMCTDRSKKMIDYFNTIKHDPRMKTLQMDIQTTNLPNELKGRFDFVFSCNVLMYLSDIRQTFKNVSQMLNPNGQLFFISAKRAHVHEFYKSMREIRKWTPYMNDFKNWTNYFDTKNPVSLLNAELERVGLEVLKSEYIDLIFYENDKQNILDVFDSLDVISDQIPKSDIPQYKEDYHKMISSIIDERIIDNELRFKVDFGSFVVAARKKC
ncbi:hypothetical protein WA026_023061 [Henosepilachna vigintioctopunctata]|uniref:Methyltransferase type 12 domain-containing protein n=1 Tax=Henosepilachna vigintioctopunctata TaxID=420089 RepID=A0AAW1V3B4_9CUCU